jgi:hypothetical protein
VPDLPSSRAGLVQAFEPSSLLLREGSFLRQVILAGVQVKQLTFASRLSCHVGLHVRSPPCKVRIAVSIPGWHLLGGPPGQEPEGSVELSCAFLTSPPAVFEPRFAALGGALLPHCLWIAPGAQPRPPGRESVYNTAPFLSFFASFWAACVFFYFLAWCRSRNSS